MDQPPRRSSDYANCIINKPDDGIHNILQFTKDKNNLYLMITRIFGKQENKYNQL